MCIWKKQLHELTIQCVYVVSQPAWTHNWVLHMSDCWEQVIALLCSRTHCLHDSMSRNRPDTIAWRCTCKRSQYRHRNQIVTELFLHPVTLTQPKSQHMMRRVAFLTKSREKGAHWPDSGWDPGDPGFSSDPWQHSLPKFLSRGVWRLHTLTLEGKLASQVLGMNKPNSETSPFCSSNSLLP